VWGGDLNDVGKLVRAVEALTDPSRMSDADARRFARAGGLEDFLNLRLASPDVRKQALDRQANLMDPDQVRMAVDAQIQLNLAMARFTELATVVGASVLPMVNAALEWLLNAPSISGPSSAAGGAQKAHEEAVRQNTQAIKQNTAVNAQLSNGTYGIGSRGRELPLGAMYNVWEAGLRSESYAWGSLGP
jgi:hypothetical protein